MTAEGEPPSDETPYVWDESAPAPAEVFQLWTEVGNGIDKSQTGAFVPRILAGHFVDRGPRCEVFSILNLDWKTSVSFRGWIWSGRLDIGTMVPEKVVYEQTGDA
jgi:hypothetical protein